MVIYKRSKTMPWKLDNIRFLYPPDDFVGGFSNEKMQERHKAMQEKKINDILTRLELEKNPLTAMRILNPLDHIRFLLNNITSFRENSCLEKAVLFLYYKHNTPFAAAGDLAVWTELFELCDRELMYKEGTQFPYSVVTAYRGSVVGDIRGFNWTISREKAAWFLERWRDKDLGGGSIYSLEVSRNDILAYFKDDTKEEVILTPELALQSPARAKLLTALVDQ